MVGFRSFVFAIVIFNMKPNSRLEAEILALKEFLQLFVEEVGCSDVD